MKIMNHLYTIIWMRNQEQQRENTAQNLSQHIQKDTQKTVTKVQPKSNTKNEKTYSADDIEKLLLIL